jgi:signal transduction histidine kinase
MSDSTDQLAEQHRALQVEHEALQQAYQHLQSTGQVHQDLVGMLVHDFRVPLAVIMASLDLLAGELDAYLSTDLHEVLLAANQSAQRMLQLLSNLLEVQRLESGQMPLSLQPLDVAGVLHQSAAQIGYLARQKGVGLRLCLPERLPQVWADFDVTERVVINLLDNAVRHTPERGEIVVATQVLDGHLTISVADSGPGIPVEQQARLFDRFAQGEYAPRHARGGVGLGLAFCKLAVEAQRGRIWVESRPGEGACFSFTLLLWERNAVDAQPL